MTHGVKHSEGTIHTCIQNQARYRGTPFGHRPTLGVIVEFNCLLLREVLLARYRERNRRLIPTSVHSWIGLPFSPLPRQTPPCALQNEGLAQAVVSGDDR